MSIARRSEGFCFVEYQACHSLKVAVNFFLWVGGYCNLLDGMVGAIIFKGYKQNGVAQQTVLWALADHEYRLASFAPCYNTISRQTGED